MDVALKQVQHDMVKPHRRPSAVKDLLACRRFFDLEHWRVVLVDQRGCGSSTPLGCLVDNNTPALIDDYEKLRKKLKIRKWTLFGGSWGVALSLAYAQQHANK